MSLATLTRQPLRTPIAPTPSRDHLRAVPAHVPGPLGAPPRTVSENLGVPTLHRTVVDYANFDHAASTPALESVKAAVDVALRTYSSVHRGNGYASKVTSGWYEEARAEVGAFVGARADDLVVFTRNTTDSLNLLGRSLPRDTTTFVFETEHHAALLPWNPRRTVRLPVPGSVEDALVLLGDALAASPDGPRLVVVAGASNVTGELWPVDQVVDLARQHGARVALDAAQLAPHVAVDVAALGVDFVAFSGHKLYAPFGAGVLVGRADWLNDASPYLRGGGATAQVTSRSVRWAEGAARHEAGSPNVVGAIALAAACATLTAHRETVEAHEDALATRLRAGLGAIEGVHTYSLFAEDHPRVGVATFTIAGLAARWRRRPCPRSTASGSATASSARTCSSTPCWTTPPRAPRSGPAWAWPTRPSTSTGCCARWPRWPPPARPSTTRSPRTAGSPPRTRATCPCRAPGEVAGMT